MLEHLRDPDSSADLFNFKFLTAPMSEALAVLMSFALMKMTLLACWQRFSKAHVKCQLQQ